MESTTNKHSLSVTFIICTYNRSKYLNETIQSLKNCSTANRKVEILVVDNNSSDDTSQVVAYHQKLNENKNLIISYVLEEQQGLSFARNNGINSSKYENIVFIDDDIRATELFILNWQKFFSDFPEAKAAGGKIHVQFDTDKPPWISHFILSLFGHHNLGNGIKKYPSNRYPFGGNMAFRKQIFNTVGYFNTKLGRIGKKMAANEEKELFRRIRSLNIPIYYVPDASLFHRVNHERVSVDYIKKQAIGLGNSYRIEVEKEVVSKSSIYFQQCYKMLITIFLFLGYSILMKASKGVMLLKFRFWILKGFQEN